MTQIITRQQVLDAASTDARLTERAKTALASIAASIEAGKPEVTLRWLSQRHLRSPIWAFNAIQELELAGYLTRYRQAGNMPTRMTLRLPSSEQRANDLSGIKRRHVRIHRRAPDQTLTARIDDLASKVQLLSTTIEGLIGILNERIPAKGSRS
jgi:hypothetical protein